MNEKIQADIERFRKMLQNISASYKHIDDKTIEDSVSNLEALMTDRSREIEDFFDPIACGAFKECYSLNEDFVIKFASIQNDTAQEEILLQKAAEANVSEIFLPTWYCSLEGKGPDLLLLNDEDSDRWYYDEEKHTYVENDDYVNQYADCIVIQPRILYAVQEKEYIRVPHNIIDYDKSPVIDENGNKVDFCIIDGFYVSSQTWLQDIMDIYGSDFFNRLLAFLKINDVHDLHTGNIGYYIREDGKTVPVIFDCLSSSW